jgi:single-stranded DNA-binding protein
LVALDGRLAIDKWAAQDGSNRERALIRANNLRLLGSKKDQG